MPTFEMEFEVTGLKLKIKSEREDVPHAVSAVQNQLGAMIQSAAQLASAKVINGQATSATQAAREITSGGSEQSQSSKKPSAPRTRGRGGDSKTPPLDVKHDAETYGFPVQTWSTAVKSLWLLYVVAEQTELKEMSAPLILTTFNKHFKEFGPLNPKNVGRDLGTMKKNTHFLGSDSTKDPQTWYLLQGGKEEAQKLISQSKAGRSNKE
jgi:hypothetical protein